MGLPTTFYWILHYRWQQTRYWSMRAVNRVLRRFGVFVIQVPWTGLGDHLYFSHLPRIAKGLGYRQVWVSRWSRARESDWLDLVWKWNRFIDGWTWLPGWKIEGELDSTRPGCNLLDEIMLRHEIDDQVRGHSPEVYYRPKSSGRWGWLREYDVFDPNYVSHPGPTDVTRLVQHMRTRERARPLLRMSRRNGSRYIMSPAMDEFPHLKGLETENVFDFCDLLVAAGQVYCFQTGTAVLCEALNVRAVVFKRSQESDVVCDLAGHTYLDV